jgi:hypothetical protein
VEVVNVSQVAEISVTDIVWVAFIILGSDVVNNIYYVQGVEDAYITRFRYSIRLNELVEMPVFFHFQIYLQNLMLNGVSATLDQYSQA